jgi:DNA-binding NtrC family response regulator
VVTITLPPLRERKEDIPELLYAFGSASPRKLKFTKDAVAWLMGRSWPGNVRELRNVVEQLSILAERSTIDRETLESNVAKRPRPMESDSLEYLADRLAGMPGKLGGNIEALERRVLTRALEASGWNKSAAARLIGVERRVLDRWWQRLGEEPDTNDRGDSDS